MAQSLVSLSAGDAESFVGRQLVELFPAMVCLCRDGVFAWVNPAGATLLGLDSSADLIGRPLVEFVHSDYREIVSLGLEVLAEETGVLPLKFISSRDASVIEVEVRVVPVRDADGSDLFMVEARDIRQRVRTAEALREREARLQGILDTVAEAIVTTDDAGMIRTFNRAAERIFGYTAAQAGNLSFAALIPGASATAAFLRRCAHLGVTEEQMARRRDGSEFPADVVISEMRFGKNRLYTGVIRDISARKAAEAAERRYTVELEREVEERTREFVRLSRQTEGILRSASDGIIYVDRGGMVSFVNAAASRLLGIFEKTMVGSPIGAVFQVVASTAPGASGGSLTRAMLRHDIHHQLSNVRLRRQDGSIFIAEYTSRPVDVDGEWVGSVVVFRDITARRQDEERQQIAATVFDTTADGVIVCDSAGRVIRANAGFERITGWTAADGLALGLDVVLFAGAPDALDAFLQALASAAPPDSSVLLEHEFWAVRRDETSFAVRVVVSEVAHQAEPDEGDEPEGRRLVIVINDITQRKRDEDRIRYQATYDQLTGLPNRMLFLDRLEQAAAQARRTGLVMGLMFIDLDGFKLINDTLGHDAGDQVLKGAASRLQNCVRKIDTVARLGGDEFTVIMTGLSDRRQASEVAARILGVLVDPFDLVLASGEVRPGRVSASIGIAFLPDHGDTVDAVLKAADAAMYAVKEKGKGHFCIFSPELAAPPGP